MRSADSALGKKGCRTRPAVLFMLHQPVLAHRHPPGNGQNVAPPGPEALTRERRGAPHNTRIRNIGGKAKENELLERQTKAVLAWLGAVPAARMADAILKGTRSFSGGNVTDDPVVLALKLP